MTSPITDRCLQYVGADVPAEGTDDTPGLLTKADVDTEFAAAAVSQASTTAAINTAVAATASQASIGLALSNFIQPNVLATYTAPLLPVAQIGVKGGVCPLNAVSQVPPTFAPSLGIGYCAGPFGPTSVTSQTNIGAAPAKIADFNLGVPNMAFQPAVFMVVLASGADGARPVIEVGISQGQAPSLAAQTIIARGVGRTCWNDVQAIPVMPVPSAPGHTGVGGSGYPPSYNIWLSAWLRDDNAQQVSVVSGNIVGAAAYLIRYQQ